MKMGFLGVTAHWIKVKEGKWTMRLAVIGFKALSGVHTGENLGRYMVGLLDRVGIMDKKGSKVRYSRVTIVFVDSDSPVSSIAQC